jgi:TPR repeat protein
MEEIDEFIKMHNGEEKIKRMLELDEQGAFDTIENKSIKSMTAMFIALMGSMYEGGTKLEENHNTAFLCYNVAAKMGYALAQFCVGEYYERGEYVEQNLEEAKHWYTLAAEQDDKNAKKRLKKLEKN